MSLPACQQRILDGIAGTLQARDPRLASMFSIFTRLTRQEPMPADEELTSGRLRRAAQGLQHARMLAATRRAFVIVPLVLAAFVGLLILSPASGPARRCGQVPAARATAQSAARAGGCGAAPTAGATGYPLH